MTQDSTCIVYDVDEVSADLVRRARQRTGERSHEIAAGSLSAGLSGFEPEIVPSHRDPDVRDCLMRDLEALRPLVGDSHRGVSLFEACRYDLLERLSRTHSRWRTLADVVERLRPSELVWVASPADGLEHHELAGVAGQRNGVRLDYLPARRPSRSADIWASAYAAGSPILEWWRARGRGSVPAQRHRPHIVFTEYFPNNLQALLPIARELAARGVTVTWLAARRSVAAALSRAGVESIWLDAFLPGVALLGAGFDPPRRRPPLGLACTDTAWLTRHGLAEQLSEVVAGALSRSFAGAVGWIERYHRAFEVLAPDVVVSATYSNLPGRAAGLCARRAGARAVWVQHGVFPNRYAYGFVPHDVKLLWGDYTRRSLLAAGSAPETLRVVGSSLYDDFVARTRTQPSAPAAPRVLYLASRTGGAVSSTAISRRTLTAVIEAVRQLAGATLVVKKHPGDRTTVLEDVASSHPEARLVSSGNSQNFILESDVVIVVSSTTGFEACIAGKPLIVLNLTGMPEYTDYAAYGAAIDVRSAADLAPALRRCSEPVTRARLAEGMRRLLDDQVAGARGDAACRGAAEIMSC